MMDRVRDVEGILKARARTLALLVRDESSLATEELATFSTGGHQIGVPMAYVVHAAPLEHRTEIPGGPRWLLGLTTVEGHLVSLLDLAALLGLGGSGVGDVSTNLVVESGGRKIGLAAEQLFGIEDLPRSAIAPLASADGLLPRIATLAARQLLLLDVPALFADARLAGRR
jgi:purine-binding chemotaxis protein CheW